MKLKKRKKSGRYRGSQTAKRGRASRTRGSGSQGGVGMAGTGKRGDQKKTLVIKLTGGNNYFGKSKALRRGKVRAKLKTINLSEISAMAASSKTVDLTGYKVLGDGELSSKVKIKAFAVSKSAMSKIKDSGSEIVLVNFADSEEKESSTNKKE